MNIFQTEKFDQLYEGYYKFLDAFEKCSTNIPKEVISKCVDIGKSLVWDADAVGQLQHISVHLAIKHTAILVDKYKTLHSKEQDKLLSFYADLENFHGYPEFQELIDKLNSIGENSIAKKLETARTKGKSKHNY